MVIFPTQGIGSLPKPKLEDLLEDSFWKKELGKNIASAKEMYYKGNKKDARALFNLLLLEKAGLDIVYDGEAHRIEMYQHPAENIDGTEFFYSGGKKEWVRSFDHNYFCQAQCLSQLGLKIPYHLEEFLFVIKNTSKEIKLPVTGAYTLADWSFNPYYLPLPENRIGEPNQRLVKYQAKEKLAVEFAEKIIRPLLETILRSSRTRLRIQIDEPAATTKPTEIPIFVNSFNKSLKGLQANKYKASVHICYSRDYRILFPYLAKLECSQLALEFANRDGWELGVSDEKRKGYHVLKGFKSLEKNFDIGLGVVDVHTNRVESPELVRDRILYAAQILGPEKIYVNPDCGLRTRSLKIAFKKLRNTVEGAKLARKEFEN